MPHFSASSGGLSRHWQGGLSTVLREVASTLTTRILSSCVCMTIQRSTLLTSCCKWVRWLPHLHSHCLWPYSPKCVWCSRNLMTTSLSMSWSCRKEWWRWLKTWSRSLRALIRLHSSSRVCRCSQTPTIMEQCCLGLKSKCCSSSVCVYTLIQLNSVMLLQLSILTIQLMRVTWFCSWCCLYAIFPSVPESRSDFWMLSVQFLSVKTLTSASKRSLFRCTKN